MNIKINEEQRIYIANLIRRDYENNNLRNKEYEWRSKLESLFRKK